MNEDNVLFTPVVDGFMNVPTAPVVDGLQPKKAIAPSGSSLKTCGLDTCLPVIAGQHGPAVGGQSASGVRRWQPCISNVSSVVGASAKTV